MNATNATIARNEDRPMIHVRPGEAGVPASELKPKLRIKGLNFYYGGFHALKSITMDIPERKVTAFIGPSGCGKSTLLRTLNRLHEPERGDILLDGRSVLADNPDQLRQRIGMVFQHFNLFPHRTVLDNVTLAPRKLKRLGAEQARELGLAQLDRVGLRHKADVRPGTLSGGQQQRVAIARALAMSPQVMFFDEATSALDPELVKGILELIADLGADGMTMVVVTHEMGFARSTSDAVVFMDHGQVVESGPPEQIFEAAETDRLRRFLSQVL
jgi:polar amino acid transport system ATP-binding protein